MKRRSLRFLIWGLIWCGLLWSQGRAAAAGMEFVLVIDTNRLPASGDSLRIGEETVQALENRLRQYGVAAAGRREENRLLIEVAPVSDSDLSIIRELLQRPGRLEFHMVHPSNEVYLARGLVPDGYQVMHKRRPAQDGRTPQIAACLVRTEAEAGLGGGLVKRVMVRRDPIPEQPQIMFELNDEAAAAFAKLTTLYRPAVAFGGAQLFHHVAIIFDGELYSAPRILEPIQGGRGIITGEFTVQEARTLALLMETGLSVPLRIVHEQAIAPGRERALRVSSVLDAFTSLLRGLLLLLLVAVVLGLFFLFRSQKRKSGLRAPPPLPPGAG